MQKNILIINGSYPDDGITDQTIEIICDHHRKKGGELIPFFYVIKISNFA